MLQPTIVCTAIAENVLQGSILWCITTKCYGLRSYDKMATVNWKRNLFFIICVECVKGSAGFQCRRAVVVDQKHTKDRVYQKRKREQCQTMIVKRYLHVHEGHTQDVRCTMSQVQKVASI